jgi:hypothetical protein
VSDPENGNVQVIVKRRRTRRHRRHLLIRRLLSLAVLALFTAGISAFALRYFGFPTFGRQSQAADSESALAREQTALLDQILSQVHPAHPVYPYSVVPGGVQDAGELKWVAEHDPIVAAHYAGFDYAHARVVEVTLARSVYVSYRIGNHVYWMRRRISLHKGEKLITDGRITARGRCGNQVAEKPQPAVSPAEPAPEAFEQPMQSAGTATPSPPVPFESALLSRPQPELAPDGPLGIVSSFGGGNPIAISPPALPAGLCAPVPKRKGGAEIEDVAAASGSTNGKKKLGPCGSQLPSTVPEPTTWALLVTGFVAILWKFGRKPYRASV